MQYLSYFVFLMFFYLSRNHVKNVVTKMIDMHYYGGESDIFKICMEHITSRTSLFSDTTLEKVASITSVWVTFSTFAATSKKRRFSSTGHGIFCFLRVL